VRHDGKADLVRHLPLRPGSVRRFVLIVGGLYSVTALRKKAVRRGEREMGEKAKKSGRNVFPARERVGMSSEILKNLQLQSDRRGCRSTRAYGAASDGPRRYLEIN